MDEESTTVASDQETDSTTTDQQTDTTVDNLDTSNQDQQTAEDDTTNSDGTTDSPAKFDDDLDEWIDKRGLPKVDTEAGKQAYQDLRNSQREFTRAQQAKQATQDAQALNDELKAQRDAIKTDDEDDDDDEYDKRLKAVEARAETERVTRLQSEFYSDNKVTAEQHKLITDVLKEKVARPATVDGKLAALDYWGSPEALPDLLDIANARLAKGTDNQALTEAVQKAERERIAKESNANSTSRGAKTVTTGDKTPEQARLERFSSWS